MRVLANLATYPARTDVLPEVVSRLAPQVDRLRVVLNEFGEIPAFARLFPGVDWIIPERDYKDVGKFLPACAPSDLVLLCDDDIGYPPNYVETLQRYHAAFPGTDAIIGTHGTIYADFFDGDVRSRTVYTFNHELAEHTEVNQLGTGTVLLRGWQMPRLDFMQGSQRFVDVRFAVHARRAGFPMICVKRHAGWMAPLSTEETLFTSFTSSWPPHVVREVQEIAGFAKLTGVI